MLNWANVNSSSAAGSSRAASVVMQPSSHPSTSAPGGGAMQQQERLINSTILKEEFLNGMPLQDQVKYVEVPVIEEVIRHVPRKEYVEVEKKIPRYEYEWIERVVEVPQVQYVDRHVEVPQVQEVLRHVPVRQVVDVPKEIVKYVPKIETKLIEKEVEVPGEIIEIPKPYVVENKVMLPKFVDQEIATVVAQRLHPVMRESDTDFQDVDVKEFNPYLVPVDVYLPKPVSRQVVGANKTHEHRVVDIPIPHFNALLKSANPGLSDADLEGRLITVNGVAPVAYGPTPMNQIIPPLSNEWQAQRVPGQIHVIPVNGMSFSNANTTTATTTTLSYAGSVGGAVPSGTYLQASPSGNVLHAADYQTGASSAMRHLIAASSSAGAHTPVGYTGGASSSTTTYHSTSIGGPAYATNSGARLPGTTSGNPATPTRYPTASPVVAIRA